MYVILGAVIALVIVIALAWFFVLRRLDEGNFEVGGPLHPPWKSRKAVVLGDVAQDERALERTRAAGRQLEREEHAGTTHEIDNARDRGAARA